MYERITGEDPYQVPMRIYPAIHYTMGGLWVDYNLMTTIPGLYVIGEANFSDHGANRLGASALMQGLADGYFVLPYTIGDYLASTKLAKVDAESRRVPRGRNRGRRASPSGCSRSRAHAPSIPSTASSARSCGNTAAWPAPPTGLEQALAEIPDLREQFWRDVKVLGTGEELNQSLEKAGRVADFFELGRADVPGRARAQRMLRRPLPRRIPDARRRGAARRRALTPTWRPGNTAGVGTAARRCTKSRSTSNTCIRRNGATSNANLTLHIWRQRNATRAGRAWCATRSPTSSRDMSFLEMLDVVNEDLIAKGEEPDRLRSRLPRGHLRHVRLHDQRRGSRPPAAAPPSASSTCAISRMATSSTWSPGAPRAFPVVKDLVVDRSAFDRIIAAGGFISVPTGSAPDGNAILVPKDSRRPRHGRGGLHRLRRLRGHVPERLRRRCSPAPRSRTWACCRKASPSARAAPMRMVAQANRGAVRKLHQHRRMRSRLPQGDQARSDRPHEPRLPEVRRHRPLSECR